VSANLRLSHATFRLRPDQFGQAVPLPSGFGSLAGLPFGSGVQVPQITATDPDTLASQITNLAPQQGTMSDLVRAQFAPVDKQLVGQLLATANGQDGGLVGVPSTFAVQRLSQLGLPTHFEDQTPDWWDNKIAELAGQSAPLVF
jgi:hypothetical protein